MFKRWSQWFTRTFHPFSVIAEQLTIIAELYALELSERTDHLGRPAPIRRVTEEPSRHDTEVILPSDDPNAKEDIFADAGDWE